MNFLTEYLTEEDNVNDGIIAHSRWWGKKMSKKSYPEVAYTYIEYSSAIINSRAKKIIDKLEEKLSYKE